MISLNGLFDKSASQKPKEIEVEIIDSSKDPNYKSMQIVEQNSKPLNDEKPDDAKYLSQFDQKVVKETKAKNTGKFNNQAAQGLIKKGAQTNLSEKDHAEKKEKGSKLSPTGDLAFQDKFSPKMDWTDLAKKNQDRGVEVPGDISKTSDYLKDKEEGPQTLLSTREFVYYTYFNRIKSQIQQQWEPRIKGKISKMFSQGRTIASSKDRITKLLIVLNAKGTLVKVQVVNESGIEDLDDAAIEAFKAAAPFPNPPAGIVEKDGKIKIQWDFVLEV